MSAWTAAAFFQKGLTGILNKRIIDGAVNVSARELVEFTCRCGDIDSRLTGGAAVSAMAEGARLHKKLQKEAGPSYRPEVTLKTVREFDGFSLCVSGRADGIFKMPDGTSVIDEIKTVRGSAARIDGPDPVHLAQAKVYAFIYALKNGLDHVDIRMTYCAQESGEIKRFNSLHKTEELKEWFFSVTDSFAEWVRFADSERKKRNESIGPLVFPFEYRKGQRDLAVCVYRGVERGGRMFIQAPTGIGKTMSVIFPAVKAIGEGKGERIFYLTAKTLTAKAPGEAFLILSGRGLHFRTVAITAKEKICPLEKPACSPDLCPAAKGHFDRINDALFDLISNEVNITRETAAEYAAKHNVCPYELLREAADFADGVICDYNYVFDPEVSLAGLIEGGRDDETILLIDEAHNLADRAREMYSADIVKEELLEAKRIIKNESKSIAGLFEKCNRQMLLQKRGCSDYSVLEAGETGELLILLRKLKGRLDQFFEKPRSFEGADRLLEIYFKINSFLKIAEIAEGDKESYETYASFDGDGSFFVKIFCVNPANNLGAYFDTARAAVMFSATLLPIGYYKELICQDQRTPAIYIDSPFDKKNRLIVTAEDVGSAYKRRNRTEFLRIFEYIRAVVLAKRGNYMVFFPSYKMMRDVYEAARDAGKLSGAASEDAGEFADGAAEDAGGFNAAAAGDCPGSADINIVLQEKNLTEDERAGFLKMFDDPDRPVTAFCVLGGIFSESIDLKNDRLIGVVIVGTGLPMVCAQRRIIKEHYDKKGKNGFDFAYTFPGMNKVTQAAGRLIRTKDDRGIIALLDLRFNEQRYRRLFPREWDDVSSCGPGQMRELAEKFWNG